MDKESVVFVLIVSSVIACVLVFVVPVLIEWQKRKKWKKMYDSVQIGDKYIRKLREPNPFEKQWGRVITITDKAMNKQGVPYVKYLDGYAEHSEDFSDMIEILHYEPYNNQDKKQ